jgi:hypothetical protein
LKTRALDLLRVAIQLLITDLLGTLSVHVTVCLLVMQEQSLEEPLGTLQTRALLMMGHVPLLDMALERWEMSKIRVLHLVHVLVQLLIEDQLEAFRHPAMLSGHVGMRGGL